MKKIAMLTIIVGALNCLYSDNAMEQEFTKIYQEQIWGTSLLKSDFGGSGGGSTIAGTEDIRAFLIQFLKDHPNIKTFLDVGCGEGVWQELIPWEELDVHYIGIDVVRELIDRQNIRSSHRTHMNFVYGDITSTALPLADLCFAKDVLQHWDTKYQVQFVNHNQSRYPYMLIMNGHYNFNPAVLTQSKIELLGDFSDSLELKKLYLTSPK